MKILVTGANGQLGREFRELAPSYPEYNFLFSDLPELDITDLNAVDQYIASQQPDVIINCAAYTAVDKAEQDEQQAFSVNAGAAGNLARAASAVDALLVHISTDYVFDGKTPESRKESDAANPISVYARSKYAGERLVSDLASKAFIVRTSWLYSAFGNNFVKTMRKYGAERGVLNIVSDQYGSPTYARDLAGAILAILPQTEGFSGVEVFHYANTGIASWYEFAQAIVSLSEIQCTVNPITTDQYPLPAVRPMYSVLSTEKIRKWFSLSIPPWRESLKHCIERLDLDEA